MRSCLFIAYVAALFSAGAWSAGFQPAARRLPAGVRKMQTRDATAKPDFTGVWVLNATKSKLTIPSPPVTSTFIFIHREPKWHMERTHFPIKQDPNTVTLDRVIGAPPVTTKDEDDITITRMFWDGDRVVLDQQFTGPDNAHGSNHVVYSLSADGDELTALEREEFPDGKFTNSWVFNRLPLPAMSFTYPSAGLTDAAVAKLKGIIERDQGDCDPKGSTLDIDYALVNFGPLGPGVVVRSKRGCDCGGTGNCAIYTYQRHGDAFHELPFRNDATPTGSAYAMVTSPSVFLVVSSHLSFNLTSLTFYQYFGDKFTLIGSECTRLQDPQHSNSTDWFDSAKTIIESCTSP
jgi:hypothetical protein